MYIYYGKNPYATYPIVGGHEIAGHVHSYGANVNGITKGMRVVVEPFIGCGYCYPCRVGKSNCCANLSIIGVHRPGGFAEFVAAPSTHIHAIPDTLRMSTACFAEPLAIGIQACRRAQVLPGEYVLVLGCGPIGLALIEAIRALGARPVAADVVQSRLDIAQSLGATVIPVAADILEMVLQHTGGEGAPVVIEATGNIRVMESTVKLVASGGRIVIVGLVKAGVELALPALELTRKEMTILGSRASADCFSEAIDLLATGEITYPNAAKAFNMWDALGVFKLLAEDPASVTKAVLVR
jgi:L-gulonate 5-dehydrogenase